MQTRREFMATAAAATIAPGLAHAAEPGLRAWLARQDLGTLYLVHARTSDTSGALALLARIESAMSLDAPVHRQHYGSAGLGELLSLEFRDRLHIDVVAGSSTPGVEITFRGTKDSATYVAG